MNDPAFGKSVFRVLLGGEEEDDIMKAIQIILEADLESNTRSHFIAFELRQNSSG